MLAAKKSNKAQFKYNGHRFSHMACVQTAQSCSSGFGFSRTHSGFGFRVRIQDSDSVELISRVCLQVPLPAPYPVGSYQIALIMAVWESGKTSTMRPALEARVEVCEAEGAGTYLRFYVRLRGPAGSAK